MGWYEGNPSFGRVRPPPAALPHFPAAISPARGPSDARSGSSGSWLPSGETARRGAADGAAPQSLIEFSEVTKKGKFGEKTVSITSQELACLRAAAAGTPALSAANLCLVEC